LKRAEFKGFEKKVIGENATRAGIIIQPKKRWFHFIPFVGRMLIPEVGDKHWRAIDLEYDAASKRYDNQGMMPNFVPGPEKNTIKIEFKAKYHGR